MGGLVMGPLLPVLPPLLVRAWVGGLVVLAAVVAMLVCLCVCWGARSLAPLPACCGMGWAVYV